MSKKFEFCDFISFKNEDVQVLSFHEDGEKTFIYTQVVKNNKATGEKKWYEIMNNYALKELQEKDLSKAVLEMLKIRAAINIEYYLNVERMKGDLDEE